jgi:hypothetical protein
MTAKQKKDLVIAILIIGLFLYLWNKVVVEKNAETKYDNEQERIFDSVEKK